MISLPRIIVRRHNHGLHIEGGLALRLHLQAHRAWRINKQKCRPRRRRDLQENPLNVAPNFHNTLVGRVVIDLYDLLYLSLYSDCCCSLLEPLTSSSETESALLLLSRCISPLHLVVTINYPGTHSRTYVQPSFLKSSFSAHLSFCQLAHHITQTLSHHP